MTQISGRGGNAISGSTTVYIRQWELSVETAFEDVTHSGSSAQDGAVAEEQIPISTTANITFEGDWDADAIPVADPPNLNAGQQIALKLYVGATGKYYSIPKADVRTMVVTNVVKGKVSFRVTAKSNGTWSKPS